MEKETKSLVVFAVIASIVIIGVLIAVVIENRRLNKIIMLNSLKSE